MEKTHSYRLRWYPEVSVVESPCPVPQDMTEEVLDEVAAPAMQPVTVSLYAEVTRDVP